MKRFCPFVLSLLFVSGATFGAEPVDSLSYAYGHQFTLATMAGKNTLMESEDDFKEYIRGLEDKIHDLTQTNDSSYMVSYAMGAAEAIPMIDGIPYTDKNELPPFSCIVAGLRKVGDGQIVLPADTVAAMDFINRYSAEGLRAADLDEDTRCRFYTAYGIMKAYKPGLQQYIREMRPGTACTENRQAFATGMADVLGAATEVPETAYDFGRMMALSLSMREFDNAPLDFYSFVAGAKAALGLGEQLIPRDSVETLLERQYGQQMEATGGVDSDAYFEKVREYIDQLTVEPFAKYGVDWKVMAATVADVGSDATGAFHDVVSELGADSSQIGGILMAQMRDEDGSIYNATMEAINGYPLPAGYKWFCGRIVGFDFDTTVGIMKTARAFDAEVHEAMVDFDSNSGLISVSWTYDAADALKWAEFTESNIGRHVAVEIDGAFMFAPKVNMQITGGRCAVTGLAPGEVNRLFKDARKLHTPK